MPRLSLWRPNHSNDYKFFDRRISEMFTIGGTDINIHKYLGPLEQNGSTDATKPDYTNQSAQNIQDLLFLENRDRKYDTSIYTIRGIYRINDNDFDLTQFGLFLTSDTLFIVFHLNDMVETVGRKIIVGDVIELPHLKDYYPLNDDLPAALKRYYVVQDATRGAEGFSPTWFGHLWRVKVQPLVDSQEYKDILNNIAPDGSTDTSTQGSLSDLLSTYDKYLDINDAIVTQAEVDVPASGYDTSSFYIEPLNENLYPGSVNGGITGNTYNTPSSTVQGYLTGDGLAPNGFPVKAGIAFPLHPENEEYFLRLDFLPNRLFRYNGSRWIKIEDAVRTPLTPGSSNKTLKSSFINNTQKTMSDHLSYDVIRCSNSYVHSANSITTLFNITSKSVVTNITYQPTYGITTFINNTPIENSISNVSGNIGFTITSNITISNGDLLEYTIYSKTVNERQSLSNALRPKADN